MPGLGSLCARIRLSRWVVALGVGGAAVVGVGQAGEPSRASDWWAVRPLQKPAVPAGDFANPIDAFVTEARQAHGARANPPTATRFAEADRRTLLRRVMVDLQGLVPLPTELESFAAAMGTGHEVESTAWTAWVERLLASPRYGERWARHWLDVAHFAETHGHDQDRPRESAWPYRDYVIAALNADTPYGRFVQEQVAADVLFPEQPALIPALGFLAAGPWDESSLRDIREDTLDREIGRYLDRDDIVGNVMSAFTSVTAHCARCHDHKFDPISQRDYYALQAVFAGTEKAERLYDDEPAVLARREFWMRLQVALERNDAARIEGLVTPEIRSDARAWEQAQTTRAASWDVVRPTSFTSRQGTALELQEDGSVVARGAAPAEDVYDLVLPVGESGITALRLELLPDDSLPARGPGRAENGNLHLTDFAVFGISPDGSTNHLGVALLSASADFQQDDWGIAKAIDADAKTGWGIHPQEGHAHTAVFEVAAPAVPEFAAARTWRVVLKQEHGRQHTIGRFRLSLTRSPGPISVAPMPVEVAKILERPTESRSTAEQAVVLGHYLRARVARELAALPPPRKVYAGAHLFPVNAGQKPLPGPRVVRVLRRGEITQPQEEAGPGALACVAGLPARFPEATDEGARRAALARWLSSRDNPLVWRSIVNRVWHYHFGRGIVDTPNDFGHMGSAPVAPALLDWLATTFRDDLGGSLKRLHALILSSRTWREIAADPQSAAPLQPLSRRLDAETFRDSLLRLNGRLDLTMGGPSVKQFAMSDGIHVTPNVDYTSYDADAAGSCRRSIYRFLFRTLPDPMMDALDCPAGDQSAPVRSESFTALQAFALMNHPFLVRQGAHLAHAVEGEVHGGGLPAEVKNLSERLFLRAPNSAEAREWAGYAERHGLANLGRLLLNSNEFHFVD